MDYKDILYNYAEYFEQSDVASNVIRWIGWEIIKLLHSVCDLPLLVLLLDGHCRLLGTPHAVLILVGISVPVI